MLPGTKDIPQFGRHGVSRPDHGMTKTGGDVSCGSLCKQDTGFTLSWVH